MIIWNVIGLNKAAKHKEIGSHLESWNVSIAGLLETRVKQGKAEVIRKKLGKN